MRVHSISSVQYFLQHCYWPSTALRRRKASKNASRTFCLSMCEVHICALEARIPRMNEHGYFAAMCGGKKREDGSSNKWKIINFFSSVWRMCDIWNVCIEYSRDICCCCCLWRPTLKMPSGRHFCLDCISLKTTSYCCVSRAVAALYVWCYWYFFDIYTKSRLLLLLPLPPLGVQSEAGEQKKKTQMHWPKIIITINETRCL